MLTGPLRSFKSGHYTPESDKSCCAALSEHALFLHIAISLKATSSHSVSLLECPNVMSSLPSLVLVHGAWHGPETWRRYLIPILESKGFRCIAEQLKFSGPEASPGVGIKPSIEQIAAMIESETSQSRDVVMVCHSFGGHVGSSAIRGFTTKDSVNLRPGSGRVLGICHISTFIGPSGKALLDLTPPRDQLDHYSDIDGFEVFFPEIDVCNKFYNDCSQEDQKFGMEHLKPLASSVFEGQPARDGIYAGWLDVPNWYLRCLKDNAIPVVFQDAMLAAMRDAGISPTVRDIDADHSPFWSKQEETAGFINDAVLAFAVQ